MRPTVTFCLAFLLFIEADGQILAPFLNPKTMGPVYDVKTHELSDGHFLIYWGVDYINGQNVGSIAKVSRNGEVLNEFKTLTDGRVFSLKPAPNNKFYISGDFTEVNGQAAHGFARLNSDGSLDQAFGTQNSVGNFVIQADGKVILTIQPNHLFPYIARFNVNGTQDFSFVQATTLLHGVAFIEQSSSGEIYLSDFQSVVKLKSDGNIDLLFSVGRSRFGNIETIKCLSDDRLLVGGSFREFNNLPSPNLIVLHPNGSKDESFNVGSGAEGALSTPEINSVFERTDGTIIVAGDFSKFNGVEARLVEIHPTGSLKRIISNDYITSRLWLIETSDRKILISGSFDSFKGKPRSGIVLLDEALTVNDSFKPSLAINRLDGIFGSIAPNGTFLLGSSSHVIDDTSISTRFSLVYLNELGQVKSSFRVPGYTEYPGRFSAVTHLPNGQLVCFGYINTVFPKLHLINPDFSIDDSFGGGQFTSNNQSIEMEGVNKIKAWNATIFVCGAFDQYDGITTRGIVGLNADGSIHRTFPSLPEGTDIREFDIQANGKITTYGYFPGHGNGILRLNADGSLDDSFPFVSVDGSVKEICMGENNSFYIVGHLYRYGNTAVKDICRVGSDGQIDTSFATGIGFSDGKGFEIILAMELLATGDIAVGGHFNSYKGQPAHGFAILDRSGEIIPSPDVRFGKNTVVVDIDFHSPHIYIVGRLKSEDYSETFGVAKISMHQTAPPQEPIDLLLSEVSPSYFKLTWSQEVDDENGFIIEKSTSPDSGFKVISVLGNNIHDYYDNDVRPNIRYYYRVAAFNDGGYSNYSNIVDDIWMVTPPGKPDSLLVRHLIQGAFQLSWRDNSTDELGFIVEKSERELTGFMVIDTLLANTTSYTDKEIKPDTELFYRTKAYNLGGESPYSNIASLKWIQVPLKPTELTLSQIKLNELKIAWKDNATNELGYIIKRGFGVSSTFETLDSVDVNGTEYTDVTIQPDKLYQYKVVAYNDGGHSDPSNTQSFVTMYVPQSPTDLTAIVNQRTVVLSWNDMSVNEDGFLIERSKDGGNQFTESFIVSGNVTQYRDEADIIENMSYRVRSFNSVGTSAFSNICEVRLILGIMDASTTSVIFPNPVKNTMFVLLKEGLGCKFTLRNQLGQTVVSGIFEKLPSWIDTSFLTPSTYTLTLEYPDGTKKIYRLVKVEQ